MAERTVLVFDLNGTLLDLSALDKSFQDEFGSAGIRQEWFQEAIKIALALTASGRFKPFGEIQQAALKVIEARHKSKLSWLTRRRVLSSMRSLPPFPDVLPGLRRLQSQGVRLAVLTNSGKKVVPEAVDNAGLSGCFEALFSAESAGWLKPAAEPYRYASKQLGVKPKQITMVAAHSWDLMGAHEAGLRTCFVRRPGQVLDELTPLPELIVNDIGELAESLVRQGVDQDRPIRAHDH